MNETEKNITENNFYLSLQCNSINSSELDSIIKANKVTKTGVEVPKGDKVMTFKGIASQKYDVGESSRNNYKYDQKGWDFSEYMNNPIILWQHDSYYGGIGHATSFFLDTEGNLNILFYVDLDTLEPRNAVQVQKGLVAGISTGAKTVEYMFEDSESGAMLNEEDAEKKYGWENVWRALMGWKSEFLTLVITKAKMIENSLVTIGSNDKAMASPNSIGNSFKGIAEEYKNKNSSNPTPLISNLMPNMDEDKKVPETETPKVDAPAPADADTNGVEGEKITLENAIAQANAFKEENEALKNQIVGMKVTHESEINSLKAEHEKTLTDAVNASRADERANLTTIVGAKNNADTTTETTSDVKTPEELANKYIPSR